MSSKYLDKYEYLTGEDLGYKPSVVEKAKFGYFSMGIVFEKVFWNDTIKNIAKSKSDYNYDSKHAFFEFYWDFERTIMTVKMMRIKRKRLTTNGLNYLIKQIKS